MIIKMKNIPTNNRKPEYSVDQIFLNRWSPRAMSGESISDKELMNLFEAARWAPSSYNNQEWRFIYAKKDRIYWDEFLDLLTEPNRIWCKNSAVLVVLVSKTTFDHNEKPDNTHSLSAGAAWMSLALQGSINGLAIHGMAGFDYEKAKTLLKIPDNHKVEMMIAIGKPGKKEDLPENLQKIEVPSGRKPISKIVFEGRLR